MFSRLTRTAAIALAATLPLVACDTGVTGSETGHLTILLTDEPGDFHRAVVTIDQVYLQGSDEEGEGGRVVLRDDPVTTDLLTLANDVMELVEDAEVPAGTWAQLRFVISGGFIEVEQEDGSTRIYASHEGYSEEHHPDNLPRDGNLQMPSFAQSGLKVNVPGGALQVSGGQNIVLVDFNVAESFGRQAGASGMWVMHPVIHAVEFNLSSSITVNLALDDEVELPEGVSLGDFAAHVEDGDGNTKEEAFEESNGTWSASFRYLLPGVTWELTLVLPEEGVESVDTDPGLPLDVETLSGTDVEVTLVITGVEEEDDES
jgi:hypothetical protein